MELSKEAKLKQDAEFAESVDEILLNKKGTQVSMEEVKEVNEKAILPVSEDGLVLPQDNELLRMMQADREMGADNIGAGSLPLLKLYQPGKSVVEMASGKAPNDGWFFYRPTQSQYEKVHCYILSISDGYRAKPRNPGDKAKFTQLVSGVIDDDGKLLPFMMYVTGLKLQALWDFGKLASKFIAKVPMFSLKVILSSEKVKTDYGYTYIVNYDLALDDNGFVQILNNMEQYKFLRENVGRVEETMASVIRNQKNEDDGESVEVIQ